jgi:hypothetical protein
VIFKPSDSFDRAFSSRLRPSIKISEDNIRRDAQIMTLNGHPSSYEGSKLVEHLLLEITGPSLSILRPSSTSKLRRAIGAVAADLFRADAKGQWACRSMDRNSFNKIVGYVMFRRVIQGLAETGLLNLSSGSPFGLKLSGNIEGRKQTCFKLTGRIWDIALIYGIDRDTVWCHFSYV